MAAERLQLHKMHHHRHHHCNSGSGGSKALDFLWKKSAQFDVQFNKPTILLSHQPTRKFQASNKSRIFLFYFRNHREKKNYGKYLSQCRRVLFTLKVRLIIVSYGQPLNSSNHSHSSNRWLAQPKLWLFTCGLTSTRTQNMHDSKHIKYVTAIKSP